MFARQLLIAALAFTGTQAVSVEKVEENNMAQLGRHEGYGGDRDEYARGFTAGWDAFVPQRGQSDDFGLGFVEGVLMASRTFYTSLEVWSPQSSSETWSPQRCLVNAHGGWRRDFEIPLYFR